MLDLIYCLLNLPDSVMFGLLDNCYFKYGPSDG